MEKSEKEWKHFFESVVGAGKLKRVRVSPGTKAGDNYMSSIYSVEALSNEGSTSRWVLKCYPSHPIRQEFANKTNMFYKELFIYKEWTKGLEQFQKEGLKLRKGSVISPSFAPFVSGKCMDFSENKGPDEADDMHNGNGHIPIPPTPYLDPLDNYILLTDLRPEGYQMCDRQIGLDFPHCKLVVEELAKYHALNWAYKQYYKLESLATKFPLLTYHMDEEDLDISVSILKDSLKETKAALDNDCDNYVDLGRRLDNFGGTFRQILKVFYGRDEDERKLDCLSREENKYKRKGDEEELWRVLCHGDCWINNILFRYNNTVPGTRPTPEKVVLLDHAVARELCPMVELSYFLYTSTTFPLRKNYLDDLLQLYHQVFISTSNILKTKKLLPNFTINSLRLKFQRAKLYGLVMALLALPMFLKNSSEISNIDDVELKISETVTGSSRNNSSPIFQKRVKELVKEMYDDGIL